MRENIYKSNASFVCLKDKTQKDLLHLTGVYKIGFKDSVNFYVGSTTESFKIRFSRHFGDLTKSKHCNRILQSAYKKYKEMYLEIIEVCSPDKCIEREQHYIDTLNPIYNICKIAGNTFGVKLSEEVVQKKSKRVDMFDIEGNFIQTYKSMMDCFRETGICNTCISQAIRNRGLASGYQFRYCGEFDSLPKYVNPESHPVLVYSLEGVLLYKYESILKASKELHIPVGNISKHLQGKTKMCYGYIFQKEQENNPLIVEKYKRKHKFQQQVIITDLETNVVNYFDSINQIDSKICNHSTIALKRKKEGDEFVVKKRYKVQIVTCKNNELTKTH